MFSVKIEITFVYKNILFLQSVKLDFYKNVAKYRRQKQRIKNKIVLVLLPFCSQQHQSIFIVILSFNSKFYIDKYRLDRPA